MAVQAIKGVEIGLGFEAARRRGSKVHDPIHYDATQKHQPNLGYVRPTNNAGGLEGGMTNGQPLLFVQRRSRLVRCVNRSTPSKWLPKNLVELAMSEAMYAQFQQLPSSSKQWSHLKSLQLS